MRLPWDPEAQREQRHAEPGARPRGPPRLRTGAGECGGSGARPDLQRIIPAPRPRGPAAGAPNRYDATTSEYGAGSSIRLNPTQAQPNPGSVWVGLGLVEVR
jgi:hypothetical protein